MSPKARLFAALAAGLVVHVGLAVTSLRTTSAVYDETAHLPAGYTYLTARDFRLNPEHPPLLKEWAALPLLWGDVRARMDSTAWREAREWEFGHLFLYRWNDGDRLLLRSRLMVVSLACALACAVFFWTARHFGAAAGAVAFFLCLLSPDVLAHGQLVTTDLGLALFLFLSVAAFERITEGVTVGRVVLAGLAVGAAFASKFSAALLVPVLLVLTAAASWSRDPLTVTPPAGRLARTRTEKVLVLLVVLAAMGAITLAVVWASYGFEGRITRDPGTAALFTWDRLERGPARVVLRALRASGLLPDAYLYGLATVLRDSESRPSFLLGEISDRGWWSYFPVTFALKTPLALVALLGFLAVPKLRRAVPRGRAWLFVWTPVLIYAGAAVTSRLDIGHRHLLPLYPFLFAAAGAAAAAALAARGASRLLAIALLAWYAGSVLHVHPHYLSYFNEVAGGPSGGWRYLADSNVDWGQDLEGLKGWMDEHGVAHVKLSYFGTADPSYYGISCEMLPSKMQPDPERVVTAIAPGDVVAASVTSLHGVYLTPEERRFLRRLRDSPPVGRVGYSIFIYRPDFAASVRPSPADN